MELYKKHRPKRLEDVVGAESSVQTLRNMLARNKLPHTILFSGPSGCGKTTLARILRKELKCSQTDFKELNCSDFRGIDTIRDISRVMGLAPVLGSCRIWLLDEVHQLSKDGQNAALKMLEDTPAHVYFFLCTTDPQKLLKTILSRCCEIPVQSLSVDVLSSLIKKIAGEEKIKLSDDLVDEMAELALGSARTALVLLDKIQNLSEKEAREQMVEKAAQVNEAINLCRALIKKVKWKEIAEILKTLKGEPEQIRWAVLGYARSVLLNSGQYQAYKIITCFENHFYDSKEPGLARACFEAVHGE